MAEQHETVIVGGGQAGLAMSFHLRVRGLSHVILERHRLAERWRSERWTSLRFQMPNWWVALPGMAYDSDDPDGFASAPEILRFIEAYALRIAAPVRTGVEVSALRSAGDGRYALDTTDGPMLAQNV